MQFASPEWDYNNTKPSLQPNWLVTIDDQDPDAFRVLISIALPTTSVGDVLGFGFDTTLSLNATDLTFVSSNTGESITGFYKNTLSCGPGCNFNGAVTSAFDYVLRLGANGTSAGGLITRFLFLIANPADIALTADTFTRVGIRAQSVGSSPSGGNGSVKDTNGTPIFTPDPPPAVVPLPGALPLLGSALAGFGLLGWRRRQKAA